MYCLNLHTKTKTEEDFFKNYITNNSLKYKQWILLRKLLQ